MSTDTLQLISREEVFLKSPVVDRCISDTQQMWYRQFDGSPNFFLIDTELEKPENCYDHLYPFSDTEIKLDDFAVLAYAAKNKKDYVTNCPPAIQHFFGLLAVRKFYLIEELKHDWFYLPFENRDKCEALKKMMNLMSYNDALEFNVEDLPIILGLFSFSHRCDVGVINLFPSLSPIDFSVSVCDDGNFHFSFSSDKRELANTAASEAGLKIGGLEICKTYCLSLLK
jgi:hypothetical protein